MSAAAGATLRIGLVAGESSGDQLGGALIEALRARVPQIECFGVAGPKMVAAGCTAWASAEELSVLGLAEVLHHLPRLVRLRRMLVPLGDAKAGGLIGTASSCGRDA